MPTLPSTTKESRQRAQVLTHEYQAQLCTEQKKIVDQQIKRKKSYRRATQEQILKMNEACEQKLCKLVGKSNMCQETIA